MRCQTFRTLAVVAFCFTLFPISVQRTEAKYMPVRPLWNETWTDHLKRDLLLNYDKFARPAQHFNTTTVTISLTLRHVALEELKSIMTVNAWVKMYWIDEKLKWNASHYGGLETLHLGDHELWQPDIVLYNSAAGSTVDHYGNTHCIVSADGTVIWVPPSQFMVFCDLDLRLWPFDTQTCSLKLGSWTFDGEQVDIQIPQEAERPELMIENSEWSLVGTTRERNVVYYVCCPEPYIDITYNLTLKRKPASYIAVVYAPAGAITILMLTTFWLPPQCKDKITISACTSLMITLCLIYLNQKLPAIAYYTPLVVHYYSCSLILISTSLMISVVVINMSRRTLYYPLPRAVRQLLLGWLGKTLMLHDIIQQVKAQRTIVNEELRINHIGDNNQAGPPSPQNNFDEGDRQNMLPPQRTLQLEWILAATAMDRIAFFIYCFVFIILAAVFHM